MDKNKYINLEESLMDLKNEILMAEYNSSIEIQVTLSEVE